MLDEQQVTTPKLIEIFQGAYMDVSDAEESRFSVKGIQFPFLLGVMLDKERKVVRFTDYNRLHRVTQQQAALLCNEANRSFMLARFYAFEHEGAIMAATQYDMSFEKGLIPYQVISNFRFFERVAGAAVQGTFKDYLRP